MSLSNTCSGFDDRARVGLFVNSFERATPSRHARLNITSNVLILTFFVGFLGLRADDVLAGLLYLHLPFLFDLLFVLY